MNGFVRTQLAAGVAAAAAAAMVVSPTIQPPPRAETTTVSAPHVGLAASVKPLVVEPLDIQQIESARAAMARLDPDAGRRLPNLTAAVPAPQNAASDLIVAGYQFIQFWVDYGVNLADYVLGFIPYGYLIGDQISILYYSLIRPIADSVTYSLIVPVVNDPLNVWSYINGAIAVGQASVNALINTGINEFYYFFGWLIPPLPIAARVAPMDITEVEIPTEAAIVDSTTDVVTAVATVDEHVEAVTDAAPTDPPATEVIDELASTEPTTEPTEPEPEVHTETATTTTSSGGVQAQGEVRSGSQTTVTDPIAADGSATAEEPSDKTPVAEPTAAGAVEDKDKDAKEPADGPAGGVQSESPDSGTSAKDANAA